jgi:hypothetical protein
MIDLAPELVGGVGETSEPEDSQVATVRVVRVRLERDRFSGARLRRRRAHGEDPQPVELVALAQLVHVAAGEHESQRKRESQLTHT